jgi:SAM-dependent methyltransferase
MINNKIDCIDCGKRKGEECTGYVEFSSTQERELPPAPFSGCIIPITERYKKMIRPGQRVLEIGCGSWSPIKDHCDAIGATYEGIDTEEYYGTEKSVATRIENLASLSFEDECFDFVFGNQTMEHWEEYGCENIWGLFQCFRVCKFGGTVAQNVPIYFHGTKHFVNGDIERIRDLFSTFSNSVEINSWGMNAAPLPSYYAHPWYPPLRNRNAYTLDIIANKDKYKIGIFFNKKGSTGIIARLQSYSFPYFCYLIIRKLYLLLRKYK